MLESLRGWLLATVPFVTIASLGVLGVRLLLRRRPAAARVVASVSGLLAIFVAGLFALLPFRIAVPAESYRWVPQLPANFAASPLPALDTAPVAPGSVIDPGIRLDWPMIFYVCVTVVLVVRLLAGVGYVLWLRLRSKPFAGKAKIATSEAIVAPMVVGGFPPKVLLPADAEAWDSDRLRAVLAHESVHLRNGDWLWQTLASLACAVFWFNPLVWLVALAFKADIERHADDAVILEGIAPSDYAATLLEFAKTVEASPAASCAAAFVRPSGVKARIKAILNGAQPRAQLSRRTLVAVGVASALIAGSLTALAAADPARDPDGPGQIMADVKQVDFLAPSAANNYRGMLSDGRRIEVIQITQFNTKEGTVSWRPDGTRIAGKAAFAVPEIKAQPWLRAMVIRYPVKKGHDEGGDLYLDEPSRRSLNFSAGHILRGARDGYQYAAYYVGLRKGTPDVLNFDFWISDAEWKVAAIWKGGKIEVLDPNVKGFEVKEISAPLSAQDAGYMKMNHYETRPLTFMSYRYEGGFEPTFSTMVDFANPHTTPDFSRRVFTSYTLQAPAHGAYVVASIKELKSLGIQTRARARCRFEGIHIRPKN